MATEFNAEESIEAAYEDFFSRINADEDKDPMQLENDIMDAAFDSAGPLIDAHTTLELAALIEYMEENEPMDFEYAMEDTEFIDDWENLVGKIASDAFFTAAAERAKERYDIEL